MALGLGHRREETRVSKMSQEARGNPRYAHLDDRQLSHLGAHSGVGEENGRKFEKGNKGKMGTAKDIEPSRSHGEKSYLSSHDELLSLSTAAGKEGRLVRGIRKSLSQRLSVINLQKQMIGIIEGVHY